jgi:ssDNA-binding Zn-finger/Zn-ribbon topoisomerase 1
VEHFGACAVCNLVQRLSSYLDTLLPSNRVGRRMQHCEKCNHDTTLIQSVRESAMVGYVDYYRCRVCGEVWDAPEEGDEPDPPEQNRHQSAV